MMDEDLTQAIFKAKELAKKMGCWKTFNCLDKAEKEAGWELAEIEKNKKEVE